MAFIAGNGSGTPPGSSTVASTSTQDPQQQINLSQFMALMQQQQQQQQQQQAASQQQHSAAAVAASPLMQASAIPSQSGISANQAVLYQQLLLQNQLHQQQQQQQAAVAAAAAAQQQQQQPQTSALYLQQLQQLAAQLQQPQQQSAASSSIPAAATMNAMSQQHSAAAASSIPPSTMNALLLLQQQQQQLQQQQQTVSPAQSNTVSPALLLALQQQAAQQQAAQQQQQQQMNPTVAMLTNMLSQFPQSTLQQIAPLISVLASQNTPSPQQQPQQQQQQQPQVSATQLMYPTASMPQQQQQQQHSDEQKALIEYLIRQQQHQQEQQQLAALVAAANASASVSHTPRGSLSTQNSSGSLVGQQQQQPAPIHQHQQQQSQQSSSQRSSGEAVYVSIPPSTSTSASASASAASTALPDQPPSLPPQTLCARQTSSERLLSSGQSIEDHISKLISENAAIVEPNPVLLKRRPYNRQNTSGSLTSQTGNDHQTSSAQGSPGLRSPGISHQPPPLLVNSRIPTTRSQSMHEPAMLNTLRLAAVGSLTSGQPIIRNHICSRCNLKFPNEVGLNQHQDRCGGPGTDTLGVNKKDFLLKQHSTPQLNLNPSQAPLTPQQIIQQQQKFLKDQAEHQARISALVGGGAGVAPDSFLHLTTGRSSVPTVNPSPPLAHQFGIAAAAAAASANGSAGPSTSSRKPSFQPVPLESRSQSKKRLLENVKPEDYIDIIGISDSRPDSTGSNGAMSCEMAPSKIARIQAPIPLRPTFTIQPPECQPSTSALPPSTLTLKPHAFSLPSSSSVSSGSYRAPVQSGELSPESKSTREMVQLQLAFIERGTEPRPYVITIQDNDMPPIVDNDVNAAINRKMLKTITHYSRVCQTRPHFKIFGSQESQFALYSQNVASEEHVAQLFQYLACYSTKPKINEKDFCKYTIASGSAGVAHPTHSSTLPTTIPQALSLPKVEVTIPKSEPPPPKHVQFMPDLDNDDEEEDCDEELMPLMPSSSKVTSTTTTAAVKSETTPIRYASNTDELIARKQSLPGAEYAAVAAKIKPISGGRREEVEVYVRGRGRGRYVCDRCGIKCKKPSMLKKHLKSHTNIRPFSCLTCNFSFKTKGNLTKHLFSKTHRRKLEETKNLAEGEQGGGLHIDDDDENDAYGDQTEKIEKRIRMESYFVNEADHNDADDEDDDGYTSVPDPLDANNDITYRSFGQENIIYERDTHTPPTWWTLCKNIDETDSWEKPDLSRRCHSAPPMLEAEITHPHVVAAASGITVPVYNHALPQIEPNIGMIALQQIKRDGNVSKFAESVSRGDNEAQIQLTSEVIRMTKGADSMLPVVKTQEILKPLARKRTYTGNYVDQPVLSTFMSKDSFNCDQCSRKFRKESELNLHRQTHLIEKQQNAKSKSCQCSECKIQFRSRALLLKHMESAHGGDIAEMPSSTPSSTFHDEPCSSSTISSSSLIGIANGILNGFGVALPSSINSTASSSTMPPMTRSLSISNGRSFICSDCSLGFRSHGVLAKHLRTKNHVRQLCSLGKLPDDAMSLIRDNSSALASVDASDCETARTSLIAIINRLRQSSGNDQQSLIGDANPPPPPTLECNEQLSAVSPTPRNPESNFRERGSSLSKPIPKSIINNNKRNGDEEFATTTTPRKQSRIAANSSSSPIIGISSKPPKPIDTPSSTLHHTYSISDVWIPPKQEDIEIGTRFINPTMLQHLIDSSSSPTRSSAINNNSSQGNNNGMDEGISDATSRSETSTPQHKTSITFMGNNNNSNNSNAIATAPPPTILNSTKCQICCASFDSPNDLQIHFQSEHISIRDGSYFSCPNNNCEKVYPNRESLKTHLHMHYLPGNFISSSSSSSQQQQQQQASSSSCKEDLDEFTPAINHSSTSPSDLLSNGGAASPAGMNRKSSKTAHTAPKHSPGAPEETHTISGVIKVDPSIIGIKNEHQIILRCNQCNLQFTDANSLQTHYMSHFNRPHVCSICDAGFTTIEALQTHSMAHFGIAQAQA